MTFNCSHSALNDDVLYLTQTMSWILRCALYSVRFYHLLPTTMSNRRKWRCASWSTFSFLSRCLGTDPRPTSQQWTQTQAWRAQHYNSIRLCITGRTGKSNGICDQNAGIRRLRISSPDHSLGARNSQANNTGKEWPLQPNRYSVLLVIISRL